MSTASPAKVVLVYDGDCGFCRLWIERWRGVTGDSVEYAPYQEAAVRFPEISLKEFKAAVQLIEPGGKIYRAAEAVFQALAVTRSTRWLSWAYSMIPGFAPASEAVYKLVAANRVFFSKISALLWGREACLPRYFIATSLFLRLLGAIYFIAFVSLGSQVLGLLGSDGIFPAGEYLAAVAQKAGPSRFWVLPTLAWFSASDTALELFCWGGAISSVLAILGLVPVFSLFMAWLFYLSLVRIGGPFLSFQWDALLVETGFLAIFLPPLCGRLKFLCRDFKAGLIRFLLKILLFKVMFLSGVVKLASGDPAWRNLSALRYHYETQPLPPWTAWYAHHLPDGFHTFSCLIMFAVELVVPFFIFMPRRVRHFGAWVLIIFQLLIILTGNYTFFNWLTIALCLLLFDDAAWPAKLRQKLETSAQPIGGKLFYWPKVVTLAAALVVLLTSFRWSTVFEPFLVANRYGLFAVMTTDRPEIIVEGSNDRENWLPYEFKYKAGDLRRRPAFVQPHQPRLDWQLWFAALGNVRQSPWFFNLCGRLLEGSPAVLKLLAKNPFPDGPPKHIRAVVYDYHFSSADEKRREGVWWRRKTKRLYCPALSLKEGA